MHLLEDCPEELLSVVLHRLLRPTSQDAPGRSSRLAAANSAALRQHFGELTCAFLAPFAAFWQPTPPPPGNGPVPVQGPPHLPPFSHTEFLDSLVHATFPPVLLDRFANQVWLPLPYLLHPSQASCLVGKAVLNLGSYFSILNRFRENILANALGREHWRNLLPVRFTVE